MKHSKSTIILLIIVSLPFYLLSETTTQVTIYNNDLGLVRQIHNMKIQKGQTEIKIEGVSAKVDPTSVKLSFPEKQDKIQIIEQNFLYDLVNSRKIFEKYIGETIKYHLEDGSELSGKILNVEGGDLILKLPNGGIRIASDKKILDYEFPSLPEGLILKPTLQWLLDSRFQGQAEAELSYLTSGLQWHAEYVLVLAENEKKFTLASWVSLINNSGATYTDAKMKLIAGDIHRVQKERGERIMAFSAAQKTVAPQFEEREFFDYHLYDLQRPVTLKNKEIKQVALFDELSASAKKIYKFSGGHSPVNETPLKVILRIANTKENQMGLPLPKGVVRIFKKDVDETLQLIGEDRIDNTAKNDTFHLEIGKAFDVKGRRIEKNIEKERRSETKSIEIKIYNRKDIAIYAEVHESMRGDWHIKNANCKYLKKSNNLLIFPLEIPGGSSKTIEYTYKRSW